MTSLAQRKTRLVFETDDFVYECGHQRQVIVEAHPAYATVRLKGTRTGYAICYAAIYHAAARLVVEAERAVKAKERKAAKKAAKR
ncbi:MAG: hypothetical protein P4K93_16255 [Terracidiphilus sp.]|nr:hypothetical protein [Terracidiphilus sp.]